MRRRLVSVIAALVGVGGVVLIAYPFVLRPWQQHWGATAEEQARPMAGDDVLPPPNLEVTTRAVTVNAPPEDIWPWLVQMGYRRGGLYSYDRLDIRFGALDRPSVNQVLPQYQNLKEGDLLPYAKGTEMLVRRLVPNRELLLTYATPTLAVSQSWGLYPLDATHTRLVIRVRASAPAGAHSSLKDRLGFALIEVTEFPMTRQQLLGIKDRAEKLAAASRERTSS